MTKIVQIQYSNESAGRSAIRLQNAFHAANIESSIISMKAGHIRSEKIEYMGIKSQVISVLDKIIQSFLTRKKDNTYGEFSRPVLGTDISNNRHIVEADIIYFHWVLGGFLNFRIIRKIIKLGKPVVFFVHDMWAITGGCHHSFTCEKYKSHCSNCPLFKTTRERDFSFRQFKIKSRLYKHSNVYFAAESKWIMDCAKQSALTKNRPIFYIPNALDPRFKPIDKHSSRLALDVTSDRKVIAFGATAIENPYKGWSYFLEALNILHENEKHRDLILLVFGSGHGAELAQSIPFKSKFLGFLQDEYSMILAYNAADVYVVPSLADNLPTTVQESLGCGTPVTGFTVGGIPDMISHQKNGYLAEYKNPEDLAKGIEYCLENELSGSVLEGFSVETVVEKHLQLIKEVIAR